jgi:hypothetical protein
LRPQLEEVENYNVRTNEDPKMVKISKYLPSQIKSKYVELLRNYKDVVAWSYDDIKTDDTSLIEHKIPLEHSIKPSRHKFRQITQFSFQ